MSSGPVLITRVSSSTGALSVLLRKQELQDIDNQRSGTFPEAYPEEINQIEGDAMLHNLLRMAPGCSYLGYI